MGFTLVGGDWNMNDDDFFHILEIVIPIDSYFQRVANHQPVKVSIMTFGTFSSQSIHSGNDIFGCVVGLVVLISLGLYV